jgi:peptide/nickel transport system substrate-binding protein
MVGRRGYSFNSRISRAVNRRALLRVGGAAGVGGAVLLALGACGGDDKDEAPAAIAPAGTSVPTGTQPQRGGTWRTFLPTDPLNLDPYTGTALTSIQVQPFTYSRLFRFKAGPSTDPSLYQVEPDLAESLTTSEDGLNYTVKLKRNAKWHPPVSRTFNADDVVFSWERYTGQIPGTPANPGAANLKTYVDGVEKLDDYTVNIKMKTPRGDFLVSESKFLFIMPKEAGTLFDPAKRMVGTGAWLFDAYTPGSVLKFRRNPEWHLGPDTPYLDAVEVYFIAEYATRLQQFLGGNLDEVDILGNDLRRVKDTRKDTQIVVRLASLPNSYITFAGADQVPNAPWRDPRVRQAISMALDRDAMLDASYNFKEVSQLGFKLDRVWNNDISAWEKPYWLDPTGQFQFKAGDPKIPPPTRPLSSTRRLTRRSSWRRLDTPMAFRPRCTRRPADPPTT